MQGFLLKIIWITAISFIQLNSYLALRTNIIQLHSFSSVVMMQNSKTPLWYICQQKKNTHIKWTGDATQFRLAVSHLLCRRYQVSSSVWKYSCLLTSLSFHQSSCFQQQNKDHERPTISAQYVKSCCFRLFILAWLEKDIKKQPNCLHYLPHGQT